MRTGIMDFAIQQIESDRSTVCQHESSSSKMGIFQARNAFTLSPMGAFRGSHSGPDMKSVFLLQQGSGKLNASGEAGVETDIIDE